MKKQDRYTGHRYAKPNRSSENDIYSNSDSTARTTGNRKYKKRKKKWSAKKKNHCDLMYYPGDYFDDSRYCIRLYQSNLIPAWTSPPFRKPPETLGISSEVAEKI